MLVLAHTNDAAIGKDEIRGAQVVERQAVLRHQPAQASTEREAGNTGTADDAASGRQSVQLRLAIEFLPQHPTLRSNGPSGQVDVNPLHRRQIDHQAVVDHRPAGHVVPAAANRCFEAGRPRQPHSVDHICDAVAHGDGSRAFVDQAVVDLSAIFVPVVRRQQQFARERRNGFSDR